MDIWISHSDFDPKLKWQKGKYSALYSKKGSDFGNIPSPSCMDLTKLKIVRFCRCMQLSGTSTFALFLHNRQN